MKTSMNTLRPLLPRPENAPDESEQSSSRIDPPRLEAARRVTIKAACEKCRQKKKKCDGIRPQCNSCAREGAECIYKTAPLETHHTAVRREFDDLKRKYGELQETHAVFQRVFAAISSRSEVEAAEVVRRVRTKTDLDAIDRFVSDGDLLLQLRVEPETRYRHEFPWRPQMPSYLQQPDNPYLNFRIHEETFARVTGGSRLLKDIRPDLQYYRPLAAAKIMDRKLLTLQPSKWTNVYKDDEVMRTLLGQFFLYEYSWVTGFHKEDFMDSMVSGSTEFCSPLLVNTMLALAVRCCIAQPERFEYWNPTTLGYKFFAEGKRLWELEKYSKNVELPTVQAATLFHVQYVMFGLDKLAYTYATQAMAMSHQLKLFDKHIPGESIQYRRSRSITVWSLFWTQSTIAYHFRKYPAIDFTPNTPLPEVKDEPDYYGEVLVKYPCSDHIFSMQHAHAFKAKIDLVIPLNELSVKLYGVKDGRGPSTIQRDMAVFAAKLKIWYNTLPEQLLPDNIVYPTHFRIHIHYFQLVMEIETFLADKHLPLETFPPAADGASSPPLAKACFETVVRQYYLRHGFKHSDIFSSQYLHVLAFSALGQLNDAAAAPLPPGQIDDLRSTLLLAAKGLHDQGQNWFLPRSVFHLVQGQMSPADRELLERVSRINLEIQDAEAASRRDEYVNSQFPVNVTQPTDDPEGRRLGELLEESIALAKDPDDPMQQLRPLGMGTVGDGLMDELAYPKKKRHLDQRW